MASANPPPSSVFDIDPDIEIENELKFQDFSHGTTATSGIKSAASQQSSQQLSPPHTNITVFQQSPSPQSSTNGSAQPQNAGGKPFWTLEYYSQYFNVDTDSVLQRMLTGVFPVRQYMAVANGNPDLYGPFWITATVVFAVFFGNTIASSIKSGEAIYDFTKLTAAASTFYSLISIVPLILWGIIRYFNINAKFIELVGLLGYGLTIWIPISIIAAIPSVAILWIVCIVGFAVSAMFSIRNFTPIFRANSVATDDSVHPGEQTLAAPRGVRISTGSALLLVVLAVQFGVACSFRFYFLAPFEMASKEP